MARFEPLWVGVPVGDHPGAACAVETDRRTCLTGDCAELGHGAAGAAGDGQRQARIGEHRPSGRMLGAVDKHGGAFRQPGVSQRGREGVLREGAGRAQGVRPDPEHHGVASTQNTYRVGEHVGTSFENEADNAQGRGCQFDRPALMFASFDDAPLSSRGVAPSAQTGDHVPPHFR